METKIDSALQQHVAIKFYGDIPCKLLWIRLSTGTGQPLLLERRDSCVAQGSDYGLGRGKERGLKLIKDHTQHNEMKPGFVNRGEPVQDRALAVINLLNLRTILANSEWATTRHALESWSVDQVLVRSLRGSRPMLTSGRLGSLSLAHNRKPAVLAESPGHATRPIVVLPLFQH